jgi:Na+/phosphate symporter
VGTILKFIFGGSVSDTLKLAETIGAFFDEITNANMWKSLGWLLLGIALMLLGVLWWIGPSAARSGPGQIAAEAARGVAL